MVTGDLTDAKHKNRIGSEQYIDEWQTYEGILRRSKATEKYVWLDIRGNHGKVAYLLLNNFIALPKYLYCIYIYI